MSGSMGMYGSAYDPTDLSNPQHPFHALGLGLAGRRQQVQPQMQMDAPNPMAAPPSNYRPQMPTISPSAPAGQSVMPTLDRETTNGLAKMLQNWRAGPALVPMKAMMPEPAAYGAPDYGMRY